MLSAEHRIPGLLSREHEFQVPLDHGRSDDETIGLFAREVRAIDHAETDRPWLVFLQGGPGFAAPRPTDKTGWLGRALDDYHVLMLDQRGTGRSTPVTARSVTARGYSDAQASYLELFRADAIVADAELVRNELIGGRKWTVLGQSYGGFCLLHYLSEAPYGLDAALFAGGLPPLMATAEDVYRRTYQHCLGRNRRYYQRYPEDASKTRAIAQAIERDEISLPGGDRLSVRRFQQLGLLLGFSDGFELVHYLIGEAFPAGGSEAQLHYPFLRAFENTLHFDTNPIFALLHEPCYAQGVATAWAAHRVRKDHAEIDRTDGPLYFTGEMIYPWMFEEIGELRPMREAAEILAAWDGWPTLYDVEALGANEVPCAAVVYADDMYVDRGFSEKTAGAVRGLKMWLTNEYEHNGLRSAGAKVLGRLLDLLAER